MSRAFTSATLERVVEHGLCSGCGLCAAIGGDAVSMRLRAPGYARPEQHRPLDARQEAAIDRSCPGSVVAPWPATGTADPLWGPSLEVATGYATDDTVRHAASSGGVLSALAIHALSSGLADRVVQVAMDDDAPLLTRLQVSHDAGAVVAAAGSRYAPASPLTGIADELDRGGRLVFIGKPCDVSALRQYATLDPRVGEVVALMLSFFCAGTPSQAGTDRIVARLGADKTRLRSFRYRGDGWPGYATAVDDNGSTTRMSYAESWGAILSKEVQFRCKICPDAVGGVADIACADAWYGDEAGYPSFDEAEGRSLVMVRSAAGKALLDAARAAGAIATSPLDRTEIIRMQPHQARRKRLVASRLAGTAAALEPRPAVAGLGVGAAARQASAAEQLKSLLGTTRRVARRRLTRNRAETSN